jgi:hypothetical protein
MRLKFRKFSIAKAFINTATKFIIQIPAFVRISPAGFRDVVPEKAGKQGSPPIEYGAGLAKPGMTVSAG